MCKNILSVLQQQLHVLRRGPGGQLPARRALPRRGAVPRGRAGLPRAQGEAVRHLQQNILCVTSASAVCRHVSHV